MTSHGSTCPNIGPAGIRRRARTGIVALVVSVALGAVLIATGQPRLMRLLLVVPLWGAGLGLFQAKEKT